jgi:CHAT domain
MLYNLVIPNDIHGELAIEDIFLDVVVDESLITYPWELMHDGEEFVSLKYGIGRFVNNTNHGAISMLAPPPAFDEGPLSVLLISVPRPVERDGKKFEPLKAAEAETEVIVDKLKKLRPEIELETLTGNDATFKCVIDTIRNRPRSHIVHFNGHAEFDAQKPKSSALVLQDRNMPMSYLKTYFRRKPPALFFMNACETAATPANAGAGGATNQNHVFGLARPFLETGAYLIGTRWKVGDEGAKAFAAAFYSQLNDGKPLGKMIRDARRACRNPERPDDLTWASYIYYGDPRLCFRKLPEAAAAEAPAQPAAHHRGPVDGASSLSVQHTTGQLSWSAFWTRTEAERLYSLFELSGQQAIILEGPRLSGKTRLASALCDIARSSHSQSVILLLQMKQLIRDAVGLPTEQQFLRRVLQRIWDGLGQNDHWTPQNDDLSDLYLELVVMFRRLNGTPIYLAVEDADVALWIDDPQLRGTARASTARLYSALGAIIDAPADETCRAVRQIFTTVHTAAELSNTYRVSPFNKASQAPLRPFTPKEVDELGQAAGLTKPEERSFVYSEAGGHRSLVWTILGTWAGRAKTDRNKQIPRDLLEIPEVEAVLQILKRDLDYERDLSLAFLELCQGAVPSRDISRRLERRMLAAHGEGESCHVLSSLMRRSFTG